VAQEEPYAQPTEKNLPGPCGGIRVDLCDQIFQATAKQLHVKELLGLRQPIQGVEAFPERGQFAQNAMANIGRL
jgi:hypothetical protein